MNQKRAVNVEMNETISNRVFYGWRIVAVSTLALLVSNGSAIGGIPVFYQSIINSLVASGATTANLAPSVIGQAASLTFFISGLSSPVGGALLARFSARKIMLTGCLILGAALIIYSRAAAPALIYLAHALFGLSLGLVGVLPNTVLISNWFRRRRGTALGLAITGTSLGGALIPLIAAPLIIRYGWRAAMLLVSLLVWFVLIPALLFVVRDSPRELGLEPDGEILIDAAPIETQTVAGMTFGEALRTPAFWLFGLAAAAIFYPMFTTSQQFILYLQTGRIGMSAQEASFAQSFFFVASLGGKFLFGWLSDKIQARRVIVLACALMLAGALLLFNLTAHKAFPFLVLFGAGYGGTFVLIQLLAAEFFGLREIGKILGSIFVIETTGGALGSYTTGRLASAAGGDYSTAFHYVIAATAVALIAIVALSFLSQQKRFCR